MATVPPHTHTFDIETATAAEISAGIESQKVVVPSELRSSLNSDLALRLAKDQNLADINSAKAARLNIGLLTSRPEDFGAVAGVVSSDQRTTNTTAFNSWLSYIVENNVIGELISDYYEINGALTKGSITNTAPKLLIQSKAKGGTTIKYTGAVALGNMMYVVGALRAADISDVEFNGNDLASSGISVESTYGLFDVILSRVAARTMRTAIYTTVNQHAGGIRFSINDDVTPYGGTITVQHCVVDTMVKDTQAAEPNSLANQGIIVAGFKRINIRNNSVEGITTDATARVDADGIVANSRRISSVRQLMEGEIAYNSLKNCAGRFVKLQADGNVVVHHNLCTLEGSISLANVFRGIDSQTGSCSVEDNVFKFDDQWSAPGTEVYCLYLQSPGVATSSKRTVLACRRNILYTSKTVPEFVAPLLFDVEDTTEWLIEDNKAHWTTAVASDAVTLFSAIRYPNGATKKSIIRYRRNEVAAVNFILQTASAGAGDKTTTATLDVVDNVNTRGTNFLFATSGTCWTSDMLVRGNKTGGGGENRVQQSALDMSKLRPGCSFNMGTGTISNGPTSDLNGYAIRKDSMLHMEVYLSTVRYLSSNNGTAWTPYTYYAIASKTWNPPSISAGASHTETITCTGVSQFHFLQATFSLALGGLYLRDVQVTNDGTDEVSVTFVNPTGSPIDLAQGTLYVRYGFN